MTQIKSKGTVLQLDIASTYTTIAQVTNVTAPDAEVETFDATHLGSGTGREKEPTGFVEGGTVSLSLFFDPVETTHQALTDLITTPAVSDWKIIWSDSGSTEWDFSGVLKSFTPTAELADGLKADVSIELDGIVSYPT